ncbi:MAG: hypothetical protein IPK82_06905 [Polyangiaceae bacterium]|nr:hypothetical protein [Polyangiaceae bacterium]
MSATSCAVCGAGSTKSARMSRLVMEGRPIVLCRDHAAIVAASRPATFEEFRQLFVGASIDIEAMIRSGLMVERRSPIQRREAVDRRAFPPRPEGRRRGFGRRITDPVD